MSLCDVKARYDLIDPEVIHGMALCFTDGSLKYGDYNWINVPESKYNAAYQRHMRDHHRGVYFAEDSGLLHIDHAIANLAILRSMLATDPVIARAMIEGAYK
jgi:hypothetical protein